jgi:ribonucleoside-diphosphate reductase alpha chain
MIPWDSSLAKVINLQIFSSIKQQAVAETEKLAIERGEYLDGVGSGRRNSHLLALAPNANSSIIASTSPSIEPAKSNAFTHRTRVGSFLVKNKYLEPVLEKYAPEENKESWFQDIWSSVITNMGSVQHLEFLSEDEKAVFKTAFEIDQNWVVAHAADRQPFICQGQSVNLFFPAGSEKAYVNQVHLKAWKSKLKGLYYLRTNAGITADKVSYKVTREALADYVNKEEDDCVACQG